MKMPVEEPKTNQVDFLKLSQGLLDRGALLRFEAHGRSMYPFIKHGDIIIVEPQNGSSVSMGDIIFYRRLEGSTTAHRLVKINDWKDSIVLQTKGDALKYADPPVTPAQVMGRVIMIEGHVRKLSLNGWAGRVFNWLIAWAACHRYPNQRMVVRYLDRLGWFCLGRRIK
jgi:signal peptidase I